MSTHCLAWRTVTTSVRAVAVILPLALSAGAHATEYLWTWTPASGGVNNAAGEIRSINASFDDVSNKLTWFASFGAVPGSPALKTDGFHLVLSPGPNPKGHAGELAIMYFDATAATPKMSVYGYNGFNGGSSFMDGSPGAGVQAPDMIKSSTDLTGVYELRNQLEADGSRTLGFSIDATAINNHIPLYPGSTPWTGAEFGSNIGVWFHTYAGSRFNYKANGYIWDYAKQKEGYIDLSNSATTAVPGPAAGLMGLTMLTGLRRRMKKARR